MWKNRRLATASRNSFRRFASYLAAASFGVALLLFAIRRRYELPVIVALDVAIVSAAAWAMLDWERLRGWLRGRQARYGSASVLLSVSFIGIVVIVNVLSNRFYARYDATAERRYSLSQQTLQVLSGIKEPIKVYSFFAPDDSRRAEFEHFFEEYRHRSPRLDYEAVDPDLQPALARELEVNAPGAIVFVRGERKQLIYGVQEQDITGAIIRVMRDAEPKVYFVVGHQERDPESFEAQGYSTIAQAMKDEGYQVATLNLSAGQALPEDAAVVIVAGPRQALTTDEESRLSSYIDKGGRLLLLSDPALPPPLVASLAQCGLGWGDDIIIDPTQSLMGDIATPLTNRYPFAPVTREMQGLTTFFPYARSVSLVEEGESPLATTQPLVTSGPDSWGETDLQNASPTFDATADIKGPLNICVASEVAETGARLLVCGDSEFASNDIFAKVQGSGNGDLFLNSVNWLAEEEELISIRPKPPAARTVMMTPEQGRLVQLVTAVLMPLSVVAAGGIVWWRRRS